MPFTHKSRVRFPTGEKSVANNWDIFMEVKKRCEMGQFRVGQKALQEMSPRTNVRGWGTMQIRGDKKLFKDVPGGDKKR